MASCVKLAAAMIQQRHSWVGSCCSTTFTLERYGVVPLLPLILAARGGAVMVAEAWWNIVLGGDMVFLLIANVGIQIAKEDMDLLGRKDILLREMMEEFFRAGAAGGDIGHSEMEWVLPSRGG